MTDELKRAEQLGYSKGYAAGKRRKENLRAVAQIEAKREDFRQRAFLAALPACIQAHGWQTGDKKPINSLTERIDLARDFADAALKRFW